MSYCEKCGVEVDVRDVYIGGCPEGWREWHYVNYERCGPVVESGHRRAPEPEWREVMQDLIDLLDAWIGTTDRRLMAIGQTRRTNEVKARATALLAGQEPEPRFTAAQMADAQRDAFILGCDRTLKTRVEGLRLTEIANAVEWARYEALRRWPEPKPAEGKEEERG